VGNVGESVHSVVVVDSVNFDGFRTLDVSVNGQTSFWNYVSETITCRYRKRILLSRYNYPATFRIEFESVPREIERIHGSRKYSDVDGRVRYGVIAEVDLDNVVAGDFGSVREGVGAVAIVSNGDGEGFFTVEDKGTVDGSAADMEVVTKFVFALDSNNGRLSGDGTFGTGTRGNSGGSRGCTGRDMDGKRAFLNVTLSKVLGMHDHRELNIISSSGYVGSSVGSIRIVDNFNMNGPFWVF